MTSIFKLHIEGISVSDLGVNKWIKLYSNIETTFTPKKLNEIFRDNKRLKQEVEIHKRAMSIMTAK